MARYTVQNTSGATLAVPPPVARTLKPGATTEVEAASLDTEQLAAMINNGLINIIPLAGLSAGADVVESSAKAQGGSASTTRIGSVAAPLVLAAGETMTLTHSLGAKAATVDVYNMATGANFTANADIAVAQATANALTVTSTAGGSFVVVVSWDPGTPSLGAVLLVTDSKIAVA